jgi:hypothetical protein
MLDAARGSVALSIRELIDSGDWAAAHGEADALAEICRLLARQVDDELARLAEATAFACGCPGGMADASAGWVRLTEPLRRGGGAGAPGSPVPR